MGFFNLALKKKRERECEKLKSPLKKDLQIELKKKLYVVIFMLKFQDKSGMPLLLLWCFFSIMYKDAFASAMCLIPSFIRVFHISYCVILVFFINFHCLSLIVYLKN